MRSATWVALLFLLLGSGSEPGWAKPAKQDAEHYFSLGNAAYDAGKYEESVRMFRVCLALAPDLPGPHRRLGQALKRLGRCDEALDHFLAYLKVRPTGTFSDEIRQEMAECAKVGSADSRPASEAVTSSTLTLSIGVDGAIVKINGVEMGVSPLPPLTLKAGLHRVEVSHPGFLDAVKMLDLAGGEEREVAISLEQAPEQPPPAPVIDRPSPLTLNIVPNGAKVIIDGKLVGLSPVPTIALEPGTHTCQISKPGFLPEERVVEAKDGQAIVLDLKMMRLEGSGALANLAEEASRSESQPTVAQPARPRSGVPAWVSWATLGTGGLLFVTGSALGITAWSKADRYAEAGPAQDRRDLKESGETLRLTADVLTGVGLAATLGGAALLLTSRSRTSADPTVLGPTAPDDEPAASGTVAAPDWQLLCGPGQVLLRGWF